MEGVNVLCVMSHVGGLNAPLRAEEAEWLRACVAHHCMPQRLRVQRLRVWKFYALTA